MMKRGILSIVAVCLLLPGTFSGAAASSSQAFCIQSDNGDTFLTVSGEGTGQLINFGNPKLPFDSLTLNGTMTISKCSFSYSGTQGAFKVEVTADTCTGVASYQVFKGKAMIYSATDSDMSDSTCGV